MRGFGDDWRAELDRYTVRDKFGDFIWPSNGIFERKDFKEIVRTLKERGLYFFDAFGFVPGPGEGESGWRQFTLSAETAALLTREFGPRWLGMDIGEQEARYVHRYADEVEPAGADRFHQYLNFQRHFERMGNLLGNRLCLVTVYGFNHAFLREGTYSMLGAENVSLGGQNAQVTYSLIRGAGKQFGVPWYGGVSVFTRWGYKDYPGEDNDRPDYRGPEHGTSLSLLKRMMMAQIFYGCRATGFEMGYYYPDKTIAPIGKIQKAAQAWLEKFGNPGVMVTPVALMTDTFSGWSFPRGWAWNFKERVVWGALPYEPGDYLTEAVFGLLYPRFEDAAFYHDESGYAVGTPFGDCADLVESDAPLALLRQYPVLVLAGRLAPSAELADTLRAYVAAGGRLILTQANAGLAPAGATVLPSPYGIARKPQEPFAQANHVDAPLTQPFPLLPETRRALAAAFRSQMIFRATEKPDGDGLSLVTCRREPGEYTLLLCNNTWKPKPFAIQAVAGKLAKLEELPMDDSEKAAAGYFPCFVTNAVLGRDTPSTIAAGGARMFRARLDETGAVAELPKLVPPPNPAGRALALREDCPLKESILRRPTFFRHCDSAMVDWRHLHSRDIRELREESGWLKRQGLHILVDLSSGVNLFPDIRLVDNDAGENARSRAMLRDVLEKMEALGAKDLVVARHQYLEQNMTDGQVRESMARNLKALCRDAAKRGITVHLRSTPLKFTSTGDLAAWRKAVGEPNFRAAPSLGAMLTETAEPAELIRKLEPYAGGLVLLSGAARDAYGQVSSLHVPLARQTLAGDLSPVLSFLKARGARLVYDAIYSDPDAEYADARLVEEAAAGRKE